MKESLEYFYKKALLVCDVSDEPWTKMMIGHNHLVNYPSHQLKALNDEILNSPLILNYIDELNSRTSGIGSLHYFVPEHSNYSSFYWVLGFMADMGVDFKQSGLDAVVKKIFLFQNEDGLFTTGYRRRGKIPVSLFCISAHLTSILANLGYHKSAAIYASVQYILTSQRNDGSWHCDTMKQKGERDQFSTGCVSANIFALRTLGSLDKRYADLVKPAFNQILDFIITQSGNSNCCDIGSTQFSKKLRYPAHYLGLDYINVLDTLSLFPALCVGEKFDNFMKILVGKSTKDHLLISEKTIPAWKKFSFANKNMASPWLTALVCRSLHRIYGF